MNCGTSVIHHVLLWSCMVCGDYVRTTGGERELLDCFRVQTAAVQYMLCNEHQHLMHALIGTHGFGKCCLVCGSSCSLGQMLTRKASTLTTYIDCDQGSCYLVVFLFTCDATCRGGSQAFIMSYKV